MPELISIEEAARITGFPYEEIEDWVKSRKITSFHTRTGTRMVDPENLRDFIAHIEHLGIQKLYLQLVIQDKEEEADEIIAQYDDYLFCLRSLKNIVLRLQENTGFLAEYKKTISCQDLEIERLRLEKRNMEYELRTLYKAVLKSGLSLDAPK